MVEADLTIISVFDWPIKFLRWFWFMISIGCDVLACHPFVYVTAYPEPSLCSKLPHKIVQDILDRQYVSTVDIDFSLKSCVTWIKIVKIIYIYDSIHMTVLITI